MIMHSVLAFLTRKVSAFTAVRRWSINSFWLTLGVSPYTV
jgi:hypothetical protein